MILPSTEFSPEKMRELANKRKIKSFALGKYKPPKISTLHAIDEGAAAENMHKLIRSHAYKPNQKRTRIEQLTPGEYQISVLTGKASKENKKSKKSQPRHSPPPRIDSFIENFRKKNRPTPFGLTREEFMEHQKAGIRNMGLPRGRKGAKRVSDWQRKLETMDTDEDEPMPDAPSGM
jgi:hypothetical protein